MTEHRLWKDGVLYEGKSEDVLPLLPSESVDLTVTSPPYDDMRTYDNFNGFDFEKIAMELFRVTKQGGVVVWVVNDQTENGSESLTSAKQKIFFREKCGFNIYDIMIFQRQARYPDDRRYYSCFEYMIVLAKGTPKTINLIADKKNARPGKTLVGSTERVRDGAMRQMSGSRLGKVNKEISVRGNIWEIPSGNMLSTKDKIAFEHPAIFPERLAYDHIISWSAKGDTVLDCFAGSGTTLKAAKLCGRNGIGIEMSSTYCELIKRRMSNVNPLFD